MSEQKCWFGYLDAGDKSSAVVRDDSLVTGDHETIYLYNLQRDAIVEYKKAIVEPKLRELKAKEQDQVAALQKAFRKVRNSFTPRGSKAASVPDKARPVKKPKKGEELAPIEELVDKEFIDDGGDGDSDEDEDE